MLNSSSTNSPFSLFRNKRKKPELEESEQKYLLKLFFKLFWLSAILLVSLAFFSKVHLLEPYVALGGMIVLGSYLIYLFFGLARVIFFIRISRKVWSFFSHLLGLLILFGFYEAIIHLQFFPEQALPFIACVCAAIGVYLILSFLQVIVSVKALKRATTLLWVIWWGFFAFCLIQWVDRIGRIELHLLTVSLLFFLFRVIIKPEKKKKEVAQEKPEKE